MRGMDGGTGTAMPLLATFPAPVQHRQRMQLHRRACTRACLDHGPRMHAAKTLVGTTHSDNIALHWVLYRHPLLRQAYGVAP